MRASLPEGCSVAAIESVELEGHLVTTREFRPARRGHMHRVLTVKLRFRLEASPN